jgi:DNA-binding transcriptional MerR regulator
MSKTPNEVRLHADISYRQLDHWTRKGYITPFERDREGQGHEREYPEKQANKARWMGCLVKLGIDVSSAERIARLVVEGENKLYLGHGVTVIVEPHRH